MAHGLDRSSQQLPQRKTAGFPPPFRRWLLLSGSAEQLQHALLRLVGERERGHRDRLAGRQRLAVGRFLVGVGQRQVRGAGLQHVDQVLREVLTDLHDRQVRTEVRRFRAQRGADVAERGQNLVRRVGVEEVGAGGQGRQAEARGIEGDALNRQRRLAGFVEGQVQRIALEKVDAVERGVLRGGVDLLQDVVVLRDQPGTGGLRVRIDDRCRAASPLKAKPAAAAVPLMAPMVDEAALLLVVMVMTPVESMVACRLLAGQRGVELVQRRDLASAGAEGDVGCRTAAGRGDGQRLAAQRRRGAGRRLGDARRRQAERCQRCGVAGGDGQRTVVVPVCSAIAPEVTAEPVPPLRRCRSRSASWQPFPYAGRDSGAGGAAGRAAGAGVVELDRLAVDREGVARRELRRQRAGGLRRGALEQGAVASAVVLVAPPVRVW